MIRTGDESWLPDLAGGDHGHGLMVGRVEADVETNRVHQSGGVCSRHEEDHRASLRLIREVWDPGVSASTSGWFGLAMWITSMSGADAIASTLS